MRVNKAVCKGCGTCVEICPGDLLTLDRSGRFAEIREKSDCWDCMSCVKSCPQGAIQTRLPYEIALYGATLRPEIGAEFIRWRLRGHKVEREFVSRRVSTPLSSR